MGRGVESFAVLKVFNTKIYSTIFFYNRRFTYEIKNSAIIAGVLGAPFSQENEQLLSQLTERKILHIKKLTCKLRADLYDITRVKKKKEKRKLIVERK